ncbi:MAG: PAS domain S-box protein [Terriglobales bacterium]|jgi:PAS domain S-box-containing protein
MVCVVALLSFLTAKLGGTLVLRPQMLWPLWPGCAFLVAVLLLVPRRIWPILIAAGLTGFVLYDLGAGLTLRSIVLLILGDTVEVLIAVLALSYAFDGPPRLNSIKSLARYSFFAVILAPLVATSIVTAAFGGNYWIRWRIGFFTEALALLTLTPAILGWVSTSQAWIRKSTVLYFEAATLITGLTLLAYVAFVAHSNSNLPVLLYSLLPFLLWSALRFGIMGISTSMMVVSFLSTWGAVRGRGPFVGTDPLNNVISLQLFLFVGAMTFMVLAVVVEERKQTERALRMSEVRERTRAKEAEVILNAVPMPIRIAHDAQCRRMTGNRAAYEQARVPVGQNFSKSAPPDEQARYRLEEDGVEVAPDSLPMQQAAATGKPVYGRALTVVYEDGTERETVESAVPLLDEAGKPRGAVGASIDLTELRQAEKALRESERRFRALYERSPIGIALVDSRSGCFLQVNPKFSEITGHSKEELLRTDVGSITHPEDIGQTSEFLQHLAEDKLANCEIEKRYLRPDRSVRWVRVLAVPMWGKGETTRWHMALVEDITERKQAEEALCKSEERFSKAFRSSPLAVTISTEAEWRYLDVNDAFLQMIGYLRREVIGRSARELGFWAEPSQRLEMIRQLEESGRVTGFHTQFITSKRKIREAEVSAELVELDGQRCMLAITRDVTETRQLEAQLRQAQKMEAVGLLAGGISHDFNNLLNVILGNTDLLLEKVPSGKPQHYAEAIKKAGQRAAQLTRQLLAFSRKQVLRPALLDLKAAVGNIAGILRHLIGEDVQVVVEGETNLTSVWADQGQIEQILMNLATNARDAMPNGGTLTIRTENAELGLDDVARHPFVVPGPYVRLSVRDTGLGMSEEVRSRAFEPFFTTKPLGRGTGLGLATVYGIVKQSGGYVWISSAVGAGTTFDIYFPRVDEAASALVDGLDVRIESPKGTETILVLEDEESLREVTCEMLAAGGYSVLQAGRGDQGIALARQYKGLIHLMVSDVVLPDISGPSAVATVQAVHPETRVLFVSGYAEGTVVQKLIEAGAILLQKPVLRSDLMREVDKILHLRNPSPSTDGSL